MLRPPRHRAYRAIKIAVFLGTTLPILFMAVYGFRRVHDDLTQLVLARRQSLAHLTAVSVGERFDGLGHVAISLAGRVQFRKLVTEGRWTEAVAILRDVHRELPHIERVFLADVEGTLRADEPPLPGVVGVNFAFRDWYTGLGRGPGPYVSDVYRRAAEPRHNVVAVSTHIVSDGGAPLGILVMQVRLETLLRWIEETDVGAGGFVYLVDSKGRLAAHPHFHPQEEVVDFSGVPSVAAALSGERSVRVTWNPVEREERVSAFEPVPGHGWAVVAQQPVAEAFAPRDDTLRSLAIVYGSVSLLSVLLAGFAVAVIGRLQSREESVRELNAELSRRAEKLEAASQAKSRFVANISHELRSPLNSIIGYAELMAQGGEGPLTREQLEDVQIIVSNGRNLLALINDLIDEAKVESGRIDLYPEEVSVETLVEEVRRSQDVLARAKALRLETHVEKGLPPLVADRHRIRQAILNLVQNAVKFTSEGSVSVTARRQGGELIVSVADTGPGVPEEELATLFARFQQSKALERVKKGEGMGLGLHLAKQFVELHGGSIQAESRVGLGTTLHVRLPLSEKRPEEER